MKIPKGLTFLTIEVIIELEELEEYRFSEDYVLSGNSTIYRVGASDSSTRTDVKSLVVVNRT